METQRSRSLPRRLALIPFRPIYRFFLNRYWEKTVPKLWQRTAMGNGQKPTNERYSIGMVTYVGRYDTFFKEILAKLVTLFPDTPIVIAVNGYYDREKQLKYLEEVKTFAGQFANVTLLPYVEPQSLSKLWNQLIIHSPTEKTFIFNDDIQIAPNFRQMLEGSGILNKDFSLVNRSWSHFLISKSLPPQVGWFDERFPGVGNEDWDYEARLVLEGLDVPSFNVRGLKNIAVITTDFSYGKDMKVINRKYTGSNLEFFNSKWELSQEPRPGFVWVHILHTYAKMKDGMQTPDFYGK